MSASRELDDGKSVVARRVEVRTWEFARDLIEGSRFSPREA